MLPDPATGHVDPAEAAHDHVAPTSSDGNVSTMDAPVTFEGPLFPTTIV
jgi:hypothetical protein